MTEPRLPWDLLHEQAPDAIIFAGMDGTILAWNRAAVEIFGHSREEAIGQNLDIIIPEKIRAEHWAGYRRAVAAGETKYWGKSMPTRSMRKDGSKLYVELSFSIIKDAEGKVIGALAHARDITERWERYSKTPVGH